MNKEQASIQDLMEQLISARDPEEARELTARVRQLASQTISPEERLEMYHQARQAVRVRLLEMAEKKNLGPVVSVLLQADKKIQRGGYYGEKLPESSCAAHDLLGLLRPISAALEEAKDPMTAEHIIRQAKGLLADADNQKQREVGNLLLCQMLENEVLAKYLEEIRSYDKLFDEPEPEERFLSSLLRALEAPTNPALALSLLQYDIDHDTFYSVTPAKLVEIDKKGALMTAIMTYIAATHKVTRQEAADCEEELKHRILLRLLRWLEREKLAQFPEVSFCIRFLREIIGNSIPNEDSPTSMDSLQDVLEAVSVSHALGLEMDVEDLAMTCNDQAECLRQCVCLRPALIDMTAFSLVTQICRILQQRKVSLPPIMEQLIRLYIVLSLSARSSKSDVAFIWTAAGRKE